MKLRIAIAAFASVATLGAGLGPAAALPAAAQAAGAAAVQAPVLPLAGATPAVAATGDPSAPFVFAYTGVDKHAYRASLASPASAESLGGTLVGGLALAFVPASAGGPGWIGPYARGGDNALWAFLGFTSGGSPRWQSLYGGVTSRPGLAVGLQPSVFGGSVKAVDAVARGNNGAVFDRGAWRPWGGLGLATPAGSGPAAVNVGGTLYAFALGLDGSVRVNSRPTGDGPWSGWRSLGGRGSGDVGAASPAPGVGVVFVRGTDGAVWYNEFAGTTAGVTPGWHSLGGRLTSGVGAGSAPDGSTAVLVLGTDNHIWIRTGTWPAFGNWTRLF